MPGAGAGANHALLCAAAATSLAALLINASTALGATGDLTKKAGTDGCITDTVTTGCTTGKALKRDHKTKAKAKVKVKLTDELGNAQTTPALRTSWSETVTLSRSSRPC